MKGRAPRRQRGVAAVEAAIVLTVLVFLVFGITEIGRAMYQYDALTKSARAASRFLATRDSADANVQLVTRCLAVYGVPTACNDSGGVPSGLVPVVPGLRTRNVVVSEPLANPSLRQIATEDGTASIDVVTVTISPASAPYTFQSIVPWVFPSIDFEPIHATMPQVYF